MEMGAGTFHPATTLRALGPKPWRAAYVQPSRRPKDGRYGDNPNRLQHYYQYQVILKPSPNDVLDLYLESLRTLGIDPKRHDIRFVEDDWESPTLGAWGLGWEVWCDGMEVTQFTYFQQVGGIECEPVSAEITYGLERLAMYVQGVENVYDLRFNDRFKYGEVFHQNEREYSRVQFRARRYADAVPSFRRRRKGMPGIVERADPRAAGLRPVHQGQPRVQPAGRDFGHRARELHRARALAGESVLRSLAGERPGRVSAEGAHMTALPFILPSPERGGRNRFEQSELAIPGGVTSRLDPHPACACAPADLPLAGGGRGWCRA